MGSDGPPPATATRSTWSTLSVGSISSDLCGVSIFSGDAETEDGDAHEGMTSSSSLAGLTTTTFPARSQHTVTLFAASTPVIG